MLKNNQQQQLCMSPHAKLFDLLIKKDHILREINELVDFGFVLDELKNKYSQDMGRTAEDPIRMFKYLLLKSMFKLSDRDLVERTMTDMLFKYFLGYDPEETQFLNPSLLTKFRRLRLVDTAFMDILLEKTVQIAIDKGIITAKNKIILDSTHSAAMYQSVSPREELIKRAKNVRKAIYSIDEKMKEKMPKKREASGLLEDQIEYTKELLELTKSDPRFEVVASIKESTNYLQEALDDTEVELQYSKDQDAKVGHKTADTSFFGYKTHIAMTPERIITAATITTGEKHDGKELIALVEKSEAAGLEVEAVIADGAYSETDNLEYAEDNFKLVSKLSKVVTHGTGKNKGRFEYNKDADRYVCEAGHMAFKKNKSGRKSKGKQNEQVECYFFDVEKCKRCPFKDGCYKEGAETKTYSVKIKSECHIKQMEYMESEEFKELYSERYKIEVKNAELKNRYGYGTAQSCGLLGMNIQGATTLFLANMRRIKTLEERKGKEFQ